MNTTGASSAKFYSAVVAHYLASAICLVILSVMLLFSTEDLCGHYFSPKLLAVTHMAALGWATLVIFGASYQLIPVIFETELRGRTLPWLSFGCFIPGLLLLVHSFWTFDPGWYMQAGSILLLISIILFCTCIFLTARTNKKAADIQQEFIVSACLWLLLTTILGVLLVFNFRYAFLPKDHLQFLKLHAHMGIGGWFLLLITGVSSKLVPMFLVSRRQDKRLLNWSYYLMNSSLIFFIADTYLAGINPKTCAIAVLMLVGVVLYLVYIRRCFTSRIKRQIDLPIANTVLSFVLLVAAFIVLLLIIRYQLDGDAFAIRLTTLYGSLLFMGWISAIILGQAFKTLPFIVWVKKYGHLSGKQQTPLPGALFSSALLKIQTISFALFCILFYPGAIACITWLVYAGSGSLIITALCYTCNLFLILLHKQKLHENG